MISLTRSSECACTYARVDAHVVPRLVARIGVADGGTRERDRLGASGGLHLLEHERTDLCRRLRDAHTGGLHRADLVLSATLAAADDGTSVTHAAARRGSHTGDEADDRLAVLAGVVLSEVRRTLLLGAAADLTDHDDTLSLRVLNESLQSVDEVGAVERVTADTDDGALAEVDGGGLVDGLIGEGARAGHDTDLTLSVDVTRHDTDLRKR